MKTNDKELMEMSFKNKSSDKRKGEALILPMLWKSDD